MPNFLATSAKVGGRLLAPLVPMGMLLWMGSVPCRPLGHLPAIPNQGWHLTAECGIQDFRITIPFKYRTPIGVVCVDTLIKFIHRLVVTPKVVLSDAVTCAVCSLHQPVPIKTLPFSIFTGKV